MQMCFVEYEFVLKETFLHEVFRACFAAPLNASKLFNGIFFFYCSSCYVNLYGSLWGFWCTLLA